MLLSEVTAVDAVAPVSVHHVPLDQRVPVDVHAGPGGLLEERLDALGFHLVFCWRSDESFAAAREERLKVSGNPSQYDDLEVFVGEQEAMRRLVGGSILPTLELDVSAGDVAGAADRVAAAELEKQTPDLKAIAAEVNAAEQSKQLRHGNTGLVEFSAYGTPMSDMSMSGN